MTPPPLSRDALLFMLAKCGLMEDDELRAHVEVESWWPDERWYNAQEEVCAFARARLEEVTG